MCLCAYNLFVFQVFNMYFYKYLPCILFGGCAKKRMPKEVFTFLWAFTTQTITQMNTTT